MQPDGGGAVSGPSIAVVEAVAVRTGVPPEDLACPLGEAVDPDALDALVESARGDGGPTVTVTFDYCGYRVTVSGETGVVVE